MRTTNISADGVVNHPWGTLPAIKMQLNQILSRVLDRISQAGPNANLSAFFVGVEDSEFDVRDDDGTVYRISRLVPLGANPIMKVKPNGGGYILTYWPVPVTW